MANFFETVINVLKADERFFTAEGELLRNAVYEAAMKMDTKLLKILFENAETKARFFTDVDGIAVFDKVGFGWVINNREFLPDSYTRYKNKIGLIDGKGDFFSTSNDIELVFPYKDCVLEGGQTKEDQKKDEIFFNTTLAPDEVDRLLFAKVFSNDQFLVSAIEQQRTTLLLPLMHGREAIQGNGYHSKSPPLPEDLPNQSGSWIRQLLNIFLHPLI